MSTNDTRPSLPAGWRIQRNADGSIGLFAPPPRDGESLRTSECFTGRLGNDMNEIVFKLLSQMLEAPTVKESLTAADILQLAREGAVLGNISSPFNACMHREYCKAMKSELDRSRDSANGHVAEIQRLEQRIRELSAFKAMVNRHKPEFPSDPDGIRDVWYWQGDGEDHLESMVHQLPIVIRAEQLRELLAAERQVAAGQQPSDNDNNNDEDLL